MPDSEDKLVLENIHYQPTILDDRVWEKIKANDFDIPKEWVERGERNSFDRIKLIANDLEDNGTVLDIGCNIGFFAHILQFLGHRVTGIDNDVHVEVKKFIEKSSIDTAKDLNKKYNLDVEFIEDDFIDYLNKTTRKWDSVLFLSVFHHLFIGYGYSDFNKFNASDSVKILQLIDRHTEKYLYFEMDEIVGYPYGWGSEQEIKQNIRMYTTFDRFETLEVSKDGWAKGRTLIRCSRSSKSKKEMPELIQLSAYSRRNSVGCIKNGVLHITKEANDWDATTHPYGVTIKRQKYLTSNEVLSKLKNNPHKSICKIIDFDDYWVQIEYIDGVLLSSLAPYLKKQKDYLSNNISLTEALTIINELKEAIDHLHKNGIAHTDLISFNVMVDKNKNIKIIDLLGAVPLTENLKELDLEVFWKRCAMEIIDRANYKFLDEVSDQKMLELAWGSDKKIVKLIEATKILDEKIQQHEFTIDEKEKIIKEFNDLHRSRIMTYATKLVDASKNARTKAPVYKRKIVNGPKKIVPAPVRRRIKKAKKKLLTKKVILGNELWDISNPIVSIVTPYYNSNSTIKDTVDSVLKQTYQNYELVIVDDGSNEKGKRYLDSIKNPKIRVIKHKENIGKGSPAAARNTGINATSGKYIMCLDADDFIDPTYIEKAVTKLETQPWISMVTTNTKAFGVVDELWSYQDYEPRHIFSNNMVTTAAIYRRDALNEVGGYKENIGYEDWELWISMAEKGHFGTKIKEYLFNYRTATSSRYLEDIKKHENNLQIIRDLHPNYKSNLKKQLSIRRRLNYQLKYDEAFINLKNKDDFLLINNKKPNVLICLSWMTFGGAETLVNNFCLEVYNDFNISFITGLESENEWEYKFKDITSSIYHMPNLFDDNKILYQDFIINYLYTRDISILHIIHTSFVFEMLPEIRRKFPKLKIIVTVFNDRAHFNESLDQSNSIDIYTTDNKAVYDKYVEKLSSQNTKAKVKVIPNGINSTKIFNPALFNTQEERSKLGLVDNEVAVFFIGRLSEEKNPDTFLEVSRRILYGPNKDSYKFFIIGDGPMRKEITNKIKEINSNRLQYLGYQSDIPKYLSASDVFVLPSSIEGFPLSVIEAMAMESVVVASDVGAVSDIIENKKDGYVVQPSSVNEIIDCLNVLEQNRKIMEKVKKLSKEKVDKKYSNKVLGRNYRDLYNEK